MKPYYKITGIFLLILSIASLLIRFSPLKNLEDFWLISLFLPYWVLPLIIFSGIVYIIMGFKNKEENKKINLSSKIQLITLPSLILTFILGYLPCKYGPPDGFCMLLGLPFMLVNFIAWIVGFIILIVGLKNNK